MRRRIQVRVKNCTLYGCFVSAEQPSVSKAAFAAYAARKIAMKFMKNFFAILLSALMLTLTMAGCGDEEGEKSMPLEWIDDPQSYEDYMNNAKITSLTQLGNTYRLKNAIEKAKNGEDVNIVYLGGSITEGDILELEERYAKRSYNYFRDKFGKGDGENVHYFNAGYRGTGSILGALRCEDDVLANEPDIVFIEYAVNDGGEIADKDGFESVIRRCLEYDTKPAVVLLFARMQEGWSSQDWKKEIGEYYDLPMISYADGITYLMDNGAMTWEEFSGDYTHPNANGGEIIAEFINYFFDEVDRLDGDESDITLPEPMYDGNYANAHLLTKNSYEHTDEAEGSWRTGSTGDHFPNGWTKSFSEDNEPLVFEFTGKNAFVIYPNAGSNTFGTLVCEVYFNDELVATKEFNEYSEGGWMSATIGELYISDTVGDYRVEFTAKDDNPKCDLQVLAVAYTD